MTKEYIVTELDKELLLKMYYGNLTLDAMYNITKIPRRKITSFFKESNLSLTKRYDVLCDYFNDIDTNEKAYWLGYLYCDGYVGVGKYNNISLSSIDENIIDDLISALILSGKDVVKSVREPSDSSNNFSINNLYNVSFSNKDMKERLNKLGIYPNRKDKSFINIDLIDSKFYKYILFGMIDADGSVEKNGIVSLYATRQISDLYIDFVDKLNLDFRVKYNKAKRAYYIVFRKSNKFTNELLNEYHKYSKIDRKK